ncbi:unnamed protein product [Fusarium venenatum]|uniref:Uncharacterized protein n=1 Tax=Fusarium venenatum TaxID=56646 RepID=A0A2L2TNX9_9HYPO|nr:uncharacterized protein FVRRES_03973 [Fusarium venenatum]CEI67461.1 unnamed protein product [Fusarium venenatum]
MTGGPVIVGKRTDCRKLVQQHATRRRCEHYPHICTAWKWCSDNPAKVWVATEEAGRSRKKILSVSNVEFCIDAFAMFVLSLILELEFALEHFNGV